MMWTENNSLVRKDYARVEPRRQETPVHGYGWSRSKPDRRCRTHPESRAAHWWSGGSSAHGTLSMSCYREQSSYPEYYSEKQPFHEHSLALFSAAGIQPLTILVHPQVPCEQTHSLIYRRGRKGRRGRKEEEKAIIAKS